MSNSKEKKSKTADLKNTEKDNECIDTAQNAKDGKNTEPELINELEAKISELNEMNDKYLRLAAEYDNFRKRSVKEREQVYTEAFAAAVSAVIPAVDNLERALLSAEDGPLKDGVDMTLKQLADTLLKLGVTEIDTSDKKFNPEFHNAIMHIEDESFGENEIIEVFQKGYILGDRVIRHALVKVAN